MKTPENSTPSQTAAASSPLSPPDAGAANHVAFLWTTDLNPMEKEINSTLVLSVKQAASRHRLNVTVESISPQGPLPSIVENGKVDGVVIQGSLPCDAVVEKLKCLPVVWLLTKGMNDWADRVMPDNQKVAEISCEYFLKQGRNPVACLTSGHSSDSPAYYQRAAAFAHCSKEMGLQAYYVDETSLFGVPMEEKKGRLADKILSLDPRPAGVFIANDSVIPMIDELTRRGVKIGEDLLVVCCNREYVREIAPGAHPAVIDICVEEIGRQALELLIWRMTNRDAPPVNRHVAPKLISMSTGSAHSPS